MEAQLNDPLFQQVWSSSGIAEGYSITFIRNYQMTCIVEDHESEQNNRDVTENGFVQ